MFKTTDLKIDKKFEEKVGKAVFYWQVAVFMEGQNIHLALYSWVMGRPTGPATRLHFGRTVQSTEGLLDSRPLHVPQGQGSLSPVRVIVKKMFCLRVVLGCAFEAVILYTHISGYFCADVFQSWRWSVSANPKTKLSDKSPFLLVMEEALHAFTVHDTISEICLRIKCVVARHEGTWAP